MNHPVYPHKRFPCKPVCDLWPKNRTNKIQLALPATGDRVLARARQPWWGGCGPAWGTVSFGYMGATIAAHYVRPEWFTITAVPYPVFAAVGGVLIALGLAFWTWARRTIARGFKQGTLITDGPYGWVRHPLYTAWMLLVVPGIALLFRSWLVLTAPLVMAGLFAVFIRSEEQTLTAAFGQAYRDYKTRVPSVFPRLWG